MTLVIRASKLSFDNGTFHCWTRFSSIIYIRPSQTVSIYQGPAALPNELVQMKVRKIDSSDWLHSDIG
jgi:hypothetical protein